MGGKRWRTPSWLLSGTGHFSGSSGYFKAAYPIECKVMPWGKSGGAMIDMDAIDANVRASCVCYNALGMNMVFVEVRGGVSAWKRADI